MLVDLYKFKTHLQQEWRRQQQQTQADLRLKADLFEQAAAQTEEEHQANPLYTEEGFDAVINHVRQWLFLVVRKY